MPFEPAWKSYPVPGSRYPIRRIEGWFWVCSVCAFRSEPYTRKKPDERRLIAGHRRSCDPDVWRPQSAGGDVQVLE